MDDKDKRYYELLLQKKDFFHKIKSLTESVKFDGKPEDADTYDSLLVKREYFFMQISKLDKELMAIRDGDFTPSSSNTKLEQEVISVVKNIIHLDEALNKQAQQIKIMLSDEIKDINNGKKASIAYGYDVDSAAVSHFDSKS